MKDFGITGIWCDTVVDFQKEFKAEFNDATNMEEDGLHTYVFCTYKDYAVFAEVVYVVVKSNTVMFFYNTAQYQLITDNDFKVIEVRVNDDAGNLFSLSLYDSDELNYMDIMCDCVGNVYHLFSLNTPRAIKLLTDLYDGVYPIDLITTLTQDEIIDMCSECMQHTIDNFAKRISTAIEDDAPYEGIDENPFQNRFYDKELYKNGAPNIIEPHIVE